MRFGIITALAASTSLLLVQNTASAHEQAIAITQVAVISSADDPDCAVEDCRIEVAHRLSIHDAESTLMSVLGARADLYEDTAAQDRFAIYVADRFQLATIDGAPIALTLLGGEVERGYYWVYQEGILEAGTDALNVTQAVLMDAIPDQTNRVNIRRRSNTETLVFNGGSRPQTYRFR